MSPEVILFVLRLLSAGILVAMLLALFVVMWRDYQASARGAEPNRRSFGRVVVLRELDGSFAQTGQRTCHRRHA